MRGVRSRPCGTEIKMPLSPLVEMAYVTQRFCAHFADSFHTYFLGTYSVPGTVLGAETRSMKKTAQDPGPRGMNIDGEGRQHTE